MHARHRPSVGLVLGGGGLAGMAYHAAALTALEHDLGWDPRRAEVVVGTSAGAAIGAMLRRGVPASDLAALTVGVEARSTPLAIAEAVADRAGLPELGLGALLRFPRLPRAGVVRAWLRRPWRVDPMMALVSILADGRLDLALYAEAQAAALGDAWPDEALWLCAVRQGDLRRVVFGRDRPAPLAAAVLASCSIPAVFQPVEVDGDRYVDGGVRSATNADVLVGRDLDLVVVISPMSAQDTGGIGPAATSRRIARRKLDAEVERLETAGLPTVVIQPGAEVVDLVGLDVMDEERTPGLVGPAFLDAGGQLGDPRLRALVP